MMDVDVARGARATEVFSVEVFAAKDSAGVFTGVMMSVPCRCGLNKADTLRIEGFSMIAMRGQSVLPVDFPNLTHECLSSLVSLAKSRQRLAVAEFTASGLFDSYFLGVDVVGGA